MFVKALIIGYTPITDTASLKPAQLRNERYFRDFLAQYDLEELHFVNYVGYKEALDAINPLVVLTFSDYYAEQIKEYKKDVLLYVVHDASSIFHRKAEKEKKEGENKGKFQEAEELIKYFRERKDEEEKSIRAAAGMNYNDQYEMIKQMLISDQPDLVQKAWALLNDNNVHKNFLWMRVGIIVECWQVANAKSKEEFLTLAMEQHIENGLAEKMEDFTDVDGVSYKQYKFRHVDGSDAKFIRRIPIATQGMDRWAYESLLEKYETPNGARMLMEVGQCKELREEYQLKGGRSND